MIHLTLATDAAVRSKHGMFLFTFFIFISSTFFALFVLFAFRFLRPVILTPSSRKTTTIHLPLDVFPVGVLPVTVIVTVLNVPVQLKHTIYGIC